MAEFIPGASPPLVNIAIVFILSLHKKITADISLKVFYKVILWLFKYLKNIRSKFFLCYFISPYENRH
ncbi:hypothetical protein FMM67_09070 [Clostridium sp. ASF356]|nr:hypothetical protein [Clostridium sp. MD294]